MLPHRALLNRPSDLCRKIVCSPLVGDSNANIGERV
jgi:hypothetical protein